MTDSQVKYQQIMEDQRHNLVMEKYAAEEQESKRVQAQASKEQARSSTLQAIIGFRNAATNRMNAETNRSNALTNRANSALGAAGLILSYIFPDANTAAKVGGEIVSSLMV